VGFLTAGFQTFDFAGSYSDGLSGGQQGTGISLSVSIVMDLLGNLALNFGQHALVTTLFIAPVVYLIISRRAPLEGSLRFLLVVLFSVAFALAAFESYITVFSGDDHLSRVLMRHYEFLFPLIWLEGLRSLKEEARDAPKPFSVALSQFTFAIAFVGIGLTESVFWQASAFSDSGFTFAITEGGNWFFIAIGLLLISLFTIKFNPKGWLASALAALYFVGLGAFAIIGLFVGNSAPISSDSFALYLSTILDEDARVMVVGVDKPITEASVFLLNLPHADYEVFDDSASTIDPTEAIGVFDYVVPLSGLEIEDIGQGFIVTEWGKVSDLRGLSVGK
jgi:hypothetical protein